jgi:hypothetical protein
MSKSIARNETVLTFPLVAVDPNGAAEPLIPEYFQARQL